MYEVLPTEPLHDVKEHISNIITEIVAHLTSEEKKLGYSKSKSKYRYVGKIVWDITPTLR